MATPPDGSFVPFGFFGQHFAERGHVVVGQRNLEALQLELPQLAVAEHAIAVHVEAPENASHHLGSPTAAP